MKTSRFILVLIGIIAINILIQQLVIRIDLTADKRYSISPQTKTELRQLSNNVSIDLFLTGKLNSGFVRLQNATTDLLDEMKIYGNISYRALNQDSKDWEKEIANLRAIEIYEKDNNGRNIQTLVYPYAKIRSNGRSLVVNLLQNNSGLSGAENLNNSIESLEFTFIEAIHQLQQNQRDKIVFIEGHNELPEINTLDIQLSLSKYFDVYFGTITDTLNCLDPFKCVIIADPESPFSEKDKYILDQYIMNGGRILWLLNGVQFSNEVLSNDGFTPAIPLDINLQDMLFRYGIRINPVLVQDIQCLPIPVDVSNDPNQPQYQAMPWVYAPLLLTSNTSPITKNVMQVSSSFSSTIEFVGEDEQQKRDILLATSNASNIIPTPAQINLTDLSLDAQLFRYSHIPIGVSIEGEFQSIFAHRMIPEGIIATEPTKVKSRNTKQIFIASGSIIRNEIQNGEPLPVGYDRYTKMQFGNRDFLTNAVLYLTDDSGLISLRQKSIQLRQLNEQAIRHNHSTYQIISLLLPIFLLVITGTIVILIKKKKYTK